MSDPTKPPDPTNPDDSVEGSGWTMREEKKPEAPASLPGVDFSTFCLSLASSAMMLLGLAPHPETGNAEANLPLAKQTIDLLGLLEEKTKGNLTPEETSLLSALLYDLRLRYVEARKG